MSTFTDHVELTLQSEGPNGEDPPVSPPEDPPAPTWDEWTIRYYVVWWHLNAYLIWKAGHPVPPCDVNAEPYQTWEQDWPNHDPETMAAEGRIALYP